MLSYSFEVLLRINNTGHADNKIYCICQLVRLFWRGIYPKLVLFCLVLIPINYYQSFLVLKSDLSLGLAILSGLGQFSILCLSHGQQLNMVWWQMRAVCEHTFLPNPFVESSCSSCAVCHSHRHANSRD